MKKLIVIMLSSIISIGSILGVNIHLAKNESDTNNTDIQNITEEVGYEKEESNGIIDENVEESNSEMTDNEEKTENNKVENIAKETENKGIQTSISKVEKNKTNSEVIKNTETVTDNDVCSNSEMTKVEEKKIEQQQEKTETITENINTEEYKINQEKINQMINIINNNQTDDMKNYGYQIVVDQSIVQTTSQFTFTEKRVIDKIAWKFGTIRIYAQDYYKNGNYVWTECYLI